MTEKKDFESAYAEKTTGGNVGDISSATNGKSIIADAFGLLIEGPGRSKEFFYDFVKDSVELSRQDILNVYRKRRDRSFIDSDYDYADAMSDVFADLGIQKRYADFMSQVSKKEGIVNAKVGVISTLKQLKNRGVQVYVLTDFDGQSDKARRFLRVAGIENLVAGIVSSKDVGQIKPSKEIFDFVLKKYALSKEDVVFIGHSYDELRGAYDLGFETIACFYDLNDDVSFLKPENQLSSIDKLLEKF